MRTKICIPLGLECFSFARISNVILHTPANASMHESSGSQPMVTMTWEVLSRIVGRYHFIADIFSILLVHGGPEKC